MKHVWSASRTVLAVLLAAGCGDDPVRPPHPERVTPVSGTTPQTARVATPVAAVPAVRVTDQHDNPMAGVQVTFSASTGSGSIIGPSLDTTDATGTASVEGWVLGTRSGLQTLTAIVEGLEPATFSVTATPDEPTQFLRTSLGTQTAAVNTAVASAPAVLVRDQYDNPVPGVPVTFEVAGGGGSITGSASGSMTVNTNASGVAAVGGWVLGQTAGANALTARTEGFFLSFAATGTAGAASQIVATANPLLMAVGENGQITSGLTDPYGNQVAGGTFTYASSNEAIVRVSGTGALTAVARGAADITISGAGLTRVLRVVVAEIVTRSLDAFGVAVSSAGVVYVTQVASARVARATLPATTFTSTVPAGSVPSSVAFSPNGAAAYVSNIGSRSVSFLDVAAGTEVAETDVGASPQVVAVSRDGSRVYAGTTGTVVVLDPTTHAVITTIPTTGDINGLAASPTQSFVYASSRTGLLYEINTTTNAVARTISLGGTPQNVAVTSNGAEAWVANEGGGVNVVTLATGAVGTVVGAMNGFGIAISADESQVYATSTFNQVLYVIDRASRTLIGTRQISSSPRRVAVSPTDGTIVVANEGGSVLFITR